MGLSGQTDPVWVHIRRRDRCALVFALGGLHGNRDFLLEGVYRHLLFLYCQADSFVNFHGVHYFEFDRTLIRGSQKTFWSKRCVLHLLQSKRRIWLTRAERLWRAYWGRPQSLEVHFLHQILAVKRHHWLYRNRDLCKWKIQKQGQFLVPHGQSTLFIETYIANGAWWARAKP